MNKRMMRILALALALLVIGGTALAEVRATASVWMRTGPGRNYDQIAAFSEGFKFEYLGETQMDERPVAWYKVSSGKYTGWVSSMYTELVNESAAPAVTAEPQPTAEPTQAQTDSQVGLPALDAGSLFVDSLNPDGADEQPTPTPMSEAEQPRTPVELSAYYQADLVTAANEIGLISYRQVESEVPYQYYDGALILAGNQNVENIVVYGEGYEVFGVHVGMNANAAMACLNAAGLDYAESANGVTYEHRAAADSPYFSDANGHDSCINLWISDDNLVTEIDWSTYTG